MESLFFSGLNNEQQYCIVIYQIETNEMSLMGIDHNSFISVKFVFQLIQPAMFSDQTNI